VTRVDSSLHLLDYLNAEAIAVGLEQRTKREALELLVGLVEPRIPQLGRERLLEAILHRENVVSTGIGNHVAIPHADLPEIETPLLALGVFPDGIDFDSVDEEPVTLVFLLLGTPRSPGLHMKILARIARLSKDPEFEELERAASGEEVLRILSRIEGRQ
jgi:mannitol/fructose-specific phosphotransferase system IIA component (Ntr-type)